MLEWVKELDLIAFEAFIVDAARYIWRQLSRIPLTKYGVATFPEDLVSAKVEDA